jgi:hypothetical protein
MRRFLFVSLLVGILPAAGTAAETARQILDHRKALEDTTYHWTDRRQRLSIHIYDAGGGVRDRALEMYQRKYPSDEEKVIVFLSAPAELKGTGLLAYNHGRKPAEQWIYLPAFKRVRQITAATREESFVGTDFTYRDLDLLAQLASWSEDDAASKLRGDETVDGVPCHAIELSPKRADVGYARIVVWLGKDDFFARRVEFYEGASGGVFGMFGARSDGGSEPTKRVSQPDVRTVGAIPVAYRVTVETPKAGTHTTLDVDDIGFDLGLEDELFETRYLERGHR